MNLTDITRIELKNIGCIEHFLFKPGKATILEGRNATGKSTILKGLRSIVEGGHDPDLLRHGQPDGYIIIELSDGVVINETITKSKTTRIAKHPKYGKIDPPKKFIEGIISAIAFDPAAFQKAKKQDRLKIVLQALPIKIKREDVSFISDDAVKGIDFSDHALKIIGSDTSGLYGTLYAERKRLNIQIDEKRATVNQLSAALPSDEEQQEDWKANQLAAQEELRDLQDRTEAKIKEIEKGAQKLRDESREAHAKQKEELEKERDATIERIKADTEIAINILTTQRDSAIAGFDQLERDQIASLNVVYQPQLQALSESLGKAREKIEQQGRVAAQRDLCEQLKREAAECSSKAHDAVILMQKLVDLKKSKLDILQVDGLEIFDNDLIFNGTPFDSLSDSEQGAVTVKILRILNKSESGLMIFDRGEMFDSTQWDNFIQSIIAEGLPIITARVSDTELQARTDELILPADCMKASSKYEVGSGLSIQAAAPGIGSSKYRITRVTEEGVFGILISSTVREMDPSEAV
jgi:hypothetical protein